MAALNDRSYFRAGIILSVVVAFEGILVLPPLFLHPHATLTRLGLAPGPHVAPPLGWVLAVLVVALFVWHSRSLPSVREHLLRISWLKALALGLGVVAGILEEWVFRGLVMDSARDSGWGSVVQVMLSALAFGLAHGIWAFLGRSLRGGLAAIAATGIMGGLLAIVYLASDRSLGPCVAAHFAIDLFLEPGLVLSALRGEMSRRKGLSAPPGR